MPSDASGLSSSGILAKSAETLDTRFPPRSPITVPHPIHKGTTYFLLFFLPLPLGFFSFPPTLLARDLLPVLLLFPSSAAW